MIRFRRRSQRSPGKRSAPGFFCAADNNPGCALRAYPGYGVFLGLYRSLSDGDDRVMRSSCRHGAIPATTCFRRNLFLHRDLARSAKRVVGGALRRFAGGGTRGGASRTMYLLRWSCPIIFTRSSGCATDAMTTRACGKTSRRDSRGAPGSGKVAFALAIAILGTYDSRRCGLACPRGLRAFQSGETWAGGAILRLAVVIVSPIRERAEACA